MTVWQGWGGDTPEPIKDFFVCYSPVGIHLESDDLATCPLGSRC